MDNAACTKLEQMKGTALVWQCVAQVGRQVSWDGACRPGEPDWESWRHWRALAACELAETLTARVHAPLFD